MKKITCLALVLVLCLAVPGVVFAQNTLVIWGDVYTSSDPGTTPDGMDPGNPNKSMHVGSLEVTRGPDDDGDSNDALTVTITNAYPGYQAYIDATIINVTNVSAMITQVGFRNENPDNIYDYIRVSLEDGNGNPLEDREGFVITAGESLPVRLITRVRQAAAQGATYSFEVFVEVKQISQTRRPRILTIPGEPAPEVPLEVPDIPGEPAPAAPERGELPLTGGDMALYVFTGLLLGGLGITLKKKKL